MDNIQKPFKIRDIFYIQDTVVTLHQMTDDEKIREQCRGREKYNWDMASAIEKGRREGLTQGENRLASLINLLLEYALFNPMCAYTISLITSKNPLKLATLF